ncbi:DUF2892 domain-containing protein [Chitinophaga horti]|uniref:DUF2892 domain-containing protein n=1 Tax=Chitinophaga horti TaxID=2920382 RepID=A0ABY6J760_9BACT|nr:DUF2892 domain-containing protein [Chitinophaga horti]UYQ95427.1 DUF2892 domain-containing protein [Chitinophaga horti]
MKNNLGIIDRSIRIVLALALIGIYLTHTRFQLSDLLLLLIGPMLLQTGLKGICPLYDMAGFRTTRPVAQHAVSRRQED